jgi:hypothetical protein
LLSGWNIAMAKASNPAIHDKKFILDGEEG